MKGRVLTLASLALAALVLGENSARASFEPRWADFQLANFADAIITGRVVEIRTGTDPAVNSIYTYVKVDVTRIIKGNISEPQIVVKQLGGALQDRGLAIPGQAQFVVGEDVLLFLQTRPRDNSLYTVALWQGKFTLETLNGIVTAWREEHGTTARTRWRLEALQALVPLLDDRDVETMLNTHPVDADVAVAQPYAFLGPFRYNFKPPVDVQTGGFTGLTGGGLTEIQTVINRWNSAGSSFAFAAGTASGPSRCTTQSLNNNRVTISYNDPCDEMSNGGGTLALGGSYYTSATTTVNGQAFFTAVEGFVVVNNDSLTTNLLRQSGCFQDIHLHELGHVLGLNHTSAAGAIMRASIDNTCSTAAHPLGADDVAGLLFIYPNTTGLTPPSTAPGNVAVTVSGTSSLVVSFNAVTTDIRFAASSATTYRLDFRAAPTGPVLAQVTAAATSVSVAIPAGVLGTFYVSVTGINAAGAGPSSAPVAFSIPGGCTPPSVPTGLTGRFAGGTASASWNASPGATSYIVQAGSIQGGADFFNANIGPSTGASAAGLPVGFRAFVRVIAVNACGQQSAASPDFLVQ